MTAPATDWIIDNALWSKARPRLSVLIPFLGDDPAQLARELAAPSADIEIVLLDDGGRDGELAARIAETVQALPRPARFVRLAANIGRAKGRNRLASEARARHLLFLDADMLPDSATFVADWLAIADQDAAVAFGGFSFERTPLDPRFALHRAMALRSDCLPAAQRSLNPEKHVFTSNLLVRRDVFETVAFDERFTGWGFEDSDLAIRLGRAGVRLGALPGAGTVLHLHHRESDRSLAGENLARLREIERAASFRAELGFDRVDPEARVERLS